MEDISKNNHNDLTAGYAVTWAGIAANIFLVMAKLYAGFIGRSQALIADGVHSLSDLFSDFIVLLGLKWGRKDEDEDHPFGHGRIETISTMVIGILLIIVGVGLVYDSIGKIYDHQRSSPTLFTIFVALFSILLKEGLYRYTYSVGKKLKSSVLIANAWHHRTDALSSIAVLIGVTSAYIHPAWVLADVFAALFVTYFIVRVGGRMFWTGFREIIDTAPDKEIIQKIKDSAGNIDGVLEVHDIRSRYSGGQILTELHIVVPSGITVFEGHEIAAGVKYVVMENVEDVSRVIVHVDPKID